MNYTTIIPNLPSKCHWRIDDGSEKSRKKKNTAPRWFEKQEKIFWAKGGSWRSKKMETTVHQLNISIFHKSLDLLISSILNNNNNNNNNNQRAKLFTFLLSMSITFCHTCGCHRTPLKVLFQLKVQNDHPMAVIIVSNCNGMKPAYSTGAFNYHYTFISREAK